MRGNHTRKSSAWIVTVTLIGAACYAVTSSWFANSVYAVTQFKPVISGFIQDISQLRSSLELPVVSEVEQLKVPIRTLHLRASKSEKDKRVEPVQIYIPRDQVAFRDLVNKISRSGMQAQVEQMLLEKIRKMGPSTRPRVRVDLDAHELKLVNLLAISEEMAHQHYNVWLKTEELAKQPLLRAEFLEQIKPFLTQDQRRQIVAKLRRNADLSLHEDILPNFARRMAKRYVVYRGPNCFHASLAFHDPELARSPQHNVKEEPGYHRAMINYDELWRIISKHFYEVDPSKSPLKFGDMLVFFSVPTEPYSTINFRWIRHTSTYLFGPYTFSKGSKSPNTPYSVKTLQEEWATWQGFTANLGMKIYRRNSTNLVRTPPVDLTDWIY